MNESWKYEKYIDSLLNTLKKDDGWIIDNEFNLRSLVLHIMRKVFEVGKQSTPKPILVDLSNYHEVYNHIKNRWKDGVCN